MTEIAVGAEPRRVIVTLELELGSDDPARLISSALGMAAAALRWAPIASLVERNAAASHADLLDAWGAQIWAARDRAFELGQEDARERSKRERAELRARARAEAAGQDSFLEAADKVAKVIVRYIDEASR